MEIKYKFSYGNIINFLFSQYVIFNYHLFIWLLSLSIVGFVMNNIHRLFSEQKIILKVVEALPVSLIILWSLYLLIISFIPKKAIVNDNFIKIRKYFLNISYLFRGFNDEIFIKDIMECKIYDGKRYRFDRIGPYAVFFFNWDDLVEIKTKNEKTYLVPLKDANEFVKEISDKIAGNNLDSDF